MNAYLLLKTIHASCAVLSGTGFVVRFAWMLRASPRLGARFVRVAPHVIDTALLASAIALAWISGAVPLRGDWLTAKIAGLLAYIVIGSVALRRGRTRAGRASAGAVAIAIFAWIVSVALTKSPWGLLARLA